MKKASHTFITATALLAVVTAMPAAHATEQFQNTSVTLGYTSKAKSDPVFGTGTSDEGQSSIRVDHFGVHGYGDNYFFLDMYEGKQVGGPAAGSFGMDTKRQYSFVWNARMSLSKITGKKLDFGILDDVSLMYRMERGSYANYAADMIGPSFNLKLPGFALFQTSFLYNKQKHSFATLQDKKGHLYWNTVAMVPFKIGGANFTFAPAVWVNYSDGAAGTETYIEPDLWMKLGDSPFELGLRVQYHRYKNYSRTSPTLLARWNF